MAEPKKRGRKSAEEEARAWLRTQGLDPDGLIGAADTSEQPETFEGFRDEFMTILWKRRNELTDTAFTQALNSLARLAEANKQSDNDKVAAEPTVAEIIGSNVLLPAERKREILEAALADLDAERAAITEALGVLDEGSADR